MTTIALHPPTVGDRDRIIEIARAIPLPGLQAGEDAQNYLDTVLARSDGRAWVAVDSGDRTLGTVYLRDTDMSGVARCSTLFGKRGWETGAAVAAVKAVGAQQPALSALELRIAARNILALNQCQRAGMSREAVLSDPDTGGTLHVYRLSLP